MFATIAAAALLVLQVQPSRAAQVAEARAIIANIESNRRALAGYHWKSRIEVTLSGEQVDVGLYDAHYGDDGSIVRTRVNDGPDKPTMPLKRRKANKKQKKIEEVRAGVEALVRSYVNIGGERLSDSFSGSRVTSGGGLQLMQAHNVVRQGDSMKVQTDYDSRMPRRFEVWTSLEGEPVRLVAEFADIEQGPTYPSSIVVETEIKEDPLILTTENFSYSRP